MKVKDYKYILLGTVAAIFLLISTVSSLRLLFLAIYPEKNIKTMTYDFFMNSIDKAVKFEEAEINFSGNIILRKFYLSVTSDFNDNLSLIQCEKAVISLKFFPLLMGETVISGVEFFNPEINIYKRFGKSYYESLRQLIDINLLLESLEVYGQQSLRVKLSDADFFYREDFHDNKLTIHLYNINSVFHIKPSQVSYKIKGLIKPHKNELIKRGHLYSKGTVDLDKEGKTEIRLDLKNADLTYINEYLHQYYRKDYSIDGGFSVDLNTSFQNNNTDLKGKIETSNLNIVSIRPVQYNLVSNENIDIHFSSLLENGLETVTVNSFLLRNDIFNFNGKGHYSRKENNRSFTLSIYSNRIDLNRLSNYISPFRNLHYGGELKLDADITFNREENSLEGSSGELTVSAFEIVETRKGKSSVILSGGESSIALDGGKFRYSFSGTSGESDFNISGRSAIESVVPIKSRSEVNISSNMLDYRIPLLGLKNGLKTLHKYASIDQKRGYENIFFVQKPVGIFVNNNDLVVDITINRLKFKKKAALKNINLRLEHQEGMLATDNFVCEGYDAFYNFFIRGVFNVDFPFLQVSCMVDNFNLGTFAAHSGSRGAYGGNLAVDLDYQLTAYRLSQYLENSEGVLTVRLQDGYFRNTRVQDELQSYLQKNGYSDIDIRGLESVQFSGAFTRMGENYYFRNIQVNGDTFNCRSNGTYSYRWGVKLPLYCSVSNDTSFTNVPLRFTGKLLSPCVKLYRKGVQSELCF